MVVCIARKDFKSLLWVRMSRSLFRYIIIKSLESGDREFNSEFTKNKKTDITGTGLNI